MLEIALIFYTIGCVFTFAFLYYEENYGKDAHTHRMEFGQDSLSVQIMSNLFISILWPLVLVVYIYANTWDKE